MIDVRGYYGAELFSVLYSSENILSRNFVPRKNTVRIGTEFFPYRITIPFRTTFFQPICVKKNSGGNFCHCRVKVQIYRPSTLAVEQNFAFIGFHKFLIFPEFEFSSISSLSSLG